MKTSFPFLRIAQKYNLDYGQVLLAAEYAKYLGPNIIGYRAFASMPNDALREILEVNRQFYELQKGTRPLDERHEIS